MSTVLSRKDALFSAWSLGVLDYKLANRPLQLEVYNIIRAAWAAGHSMYTLVCHRRYGKTWIECILALEECLRAPQTQVAYLTTTKDQAQTIVVPLMEKLLGDCPEKLRPRYLKADREWHFKNGSRLKLFSSEKEAINKGRGIGARLVIGDEARNIKRLTDVISTFQPAMDTTRGLMLLTSTPPDVEGHPFDRFWDICIADGASRTIPLSQNPDADEETHKAAQRYRQVHGEAAYLREYECRRATVDNALVVLPEFTQNQKLIVVPSGPIEPNADKYVGFDVGGRDFHGIVFGTWDYVRERFAQQGEIFARGLSTPELVKEIRAKEEAIWGKDPRGRILRYMDNNNQVLWKDFNSVYGLRFILSKKQDKLDWIRRLRSMFGGIQIVVDPSCTKSIQTYREATWADTFKDYYRQNNRHQEATAEGIGHCDLVDAMLFCVRNIHRTHKVPDKPPPEDMALAALQKMHAELNRPQNSYGAMPSEKAKKLAADLRRLLSTGQRKPPRSW